MGNLCSTDQTKPKSRKSIARVKSVRDAHKIRRDAVFRDIYKVGKTIGQGGFSVVKMVTDRETGEQMACKIMSLPPPGKLKNENESTRDDIFKEIDILMGLRHPNIIYLKEYFEENNKVYIIMEYLGGGELLDALLNSAPENGDPHYSEEDAKIIFKQLISAVEYMHTKDVVHRDLKLENLLLAKPKDISTIKVADFGLAKKYAGDVTLSTICGTPQYVAPEVIKGGKSAYTYGKECDLWSCGVILFILLGGYPPFYDESEPRLFNKIRKGLYTFNDPVWKPVSEEAKDLIRRLLEIDVTRRLKVEDVLKHDWLTDKEEKATDKKTMLNTMSKMRSSMRMKNMPAAYQEPGLAEEEVAEKVKEAAAEAIVVNGGAGLLVYISPQCSKVQSELNMSLPPRHPNSTQTPYIAEQGMPTPLLDESLPIPAPWGAYFDEQRLITCPNRKASFNVFIAGKNKGPVVLCLHGGGYTGLTWALVAQQLKDTCRVVAPDLRGHGHSESDDDADLSADTLAADVIALWDRLFNNSEVIMEGRAPLDPIPPVVIVGHSMGGAIATRAAASGAIASLAGLVVIDVVEGTALASLPHMMRILEHRPARFTTLAEAVQWSLSSGTCKNAEAARISIPSQLVFSGHDLNRRSPSPATPTLSGGGATNASFAGGTSLEAIAEDEAGGFGTSLTDTAAVNGINKQQEGGSNEQTNDSGDISPYQHARGRQPSLEKQLKTTAGWRWRTPLQQSAPHWEGWFKGLSKEFLGVSVPKVLILAGTDRLDNDLLVGQMQGKFQLTLLPQAGHAIQEDEPVKTAETIANFIKRFKIGGS